jgi:hypothetical protein
MRSFLREYAGKPADFAQFMQKFQLFTSEDLEPFFDYWLYGYRSTNDLLRMP